MKIYTKTGDKGTTSLVGGTRVSKNDLRLDAYGTVDELSSWIGFILSCNPGNESVSSDLNKIQNQLFDLGCALATEKDASWQPRSISREDISFIESLIDTMELQLPKHDKFILPGGTQGASAANIARTVCRRAERIMVSLPHETCPNQELALQYVNRLSDYLFVLARFINFIAGMEESYWIP